jgi:hypothetical protein
MRNTVVSVALAVLLAPAVVAAQDADKKVAGGGDVASALVTVKKELTAILRMLEE